MRVTETKTVIRAPREKIWDLLVDLPSWPSWNTTVDKTEGRVELGKKVKVFVKLSPGRAFPVKVSELDKPSKMVWTGGMPLGLFKGVRTYTLTSRPAEDTVEFHMREVFSGPMSKMIEKSIPDMQPAFDEFAAALKQRAEATA
jgi:uncharacterized protein YndB with AHSA1/START domain